MYGVIYIYLKLSSSLFLIKICANIDSQIILFEIRVPHISSISAITVSVSLFHFNLKLLSLLVIISSHESSILSALELLPDAHQHFN